MEEREARTYYQLPLCHGATGTGHFSPQDASPLKWPNPYSVVFPILLFIPSPCSLTMLATPLFGQPGNTAPTLLFSLNPNHDF